MTYEGRTHTRLATLPGMWERTLTVSSAGKTFSITGWKVGWVIGCAELVKGVVLTNQWVQFSVSTPAQQAIAWAFEEADRPYEGHDTYFDWLRGQYARKRSMLASALTAAGLKPVVPEGGFFIMADTSAVAVPDAYMEESSAACGPVMRRDWAFCRFLVKEIGVAAIPPSAFFEERDKPLAANLARFAFCKEDASLHEAAARLLKLRPFLKAADGRAAGAVAAGAGSS
jgi:kynurenine--oxoglutarate transaminase/cysteine-S-conjugate beta-lyase/glutamine--phenylpyruvate transaminase